MVHTSRLKRRAGAGARTATSKSALLPIIARAGLSTSTHDQINVQLLLCVSLADVPQGLRETHPGKVQHGNKRCVCEESTHWNRAIEFDSSLNSGFCIPSKSSSSRRCRFFHLRTNLLTRFMRTMAAPSADIPTYMIQLERLTYISAA